MLERFGFIDTSTAFENFTHQLNAFRLYWIQIISQSKAAYQSLLIVLRRILKLFKLQKAGLI